MNPATHKPVIALVGGIGAGKSTVAGFLVRRGGFVVDADKLGHVALEDPDAKAALVERWGSSVLKPDGTVNRRAVAVLVFGNPDERRALETIVFPIIGRLATAAIAAGRADPSARFVVLDAAVLLEAGWDRVAEKLIFVDAPREVRLERVAARSGWSEADLAAREAAQWPAEKKIARADAVVTNDGPAENVEAKVVALLKDWNLLPSMVAENECPAPPGRG